MISIRKKLGMFISKEKPMNTTAFSREVLKTQKVLGFK